MRKLIVLILSILAMFSLVACSSKDKEPEVEKEPEVVLNERQKEILMEEGLTTVFEDLTYTQKKAIVAIEDMLTYLDEKYNDEFSYAGYIAKNVLEPEQLIAFKTGTDRDFDCFTVTTTENGYEDNYIEFVSSDLFSEYIEDLVREICPDAKMKVYATVTDTTLTEIPTDKTHFDGTTAGSIMVYLDGQTCDDNEYRNVTANFESLMKEHEIYCSAQVLRTKDDAIIYLTKYNYTDYLTEEYYSDRESLYVNR